MFRPPIVRRCQCNIVPGRLARLVHIRFRQRSHTFIRGGEAGIVAGGSQFRIVYFIRIIGRNQLLGLGGFSGVERLHWVLQALAVSRRELI
jgi:hypothetical protein